ncbi:MAG: hypothetical protein ATN31_04800 [Candidatus Epulonipiscioides saccharophilum]|nr:MAG: hypothetical protein ATN31_04800 [Epulopiscium sp. AS2M-Bin001]
MKKSVGANTFLFNTPTVVVGTYDIHERPNMMTAAWAGVVNSRPPMISVSLREATYTHSAILRKKAFTVAIPSSSQVAEVDYLGVKSGRDEDKIAAIHYTAKKSEIVDAPYCEEFPVILECRLVESKELGLHTMFIGEVLDVKIDEIAIKENNIPDLEQIKPFSYSPGAREYYSQGNFLGNAHKIWKTLEEDIDYNEDPAIEFPHKNIGPVVALYPTPVTVVGTVIDGKVNWINIAHIGLISHDRIMLSMNRSHYSNHGIIINETLSINLVTEDMLVWADYVGVYSGTKTDKSKVFEYYNGELSNAPLITKSPVAMECQLVDTYSTEEHDNFIVKPINTYVHKDCLTLDGTIDYEKVNPVLFEMPNKQYLNIGKVIGKCWDKYKADKI